MPLIHVTDPLLARPHRKPRETRGRTNAHRRTDHQLFPAPGTVSLYLTADQYDDVYHILQTEDPAFCTAIDGSVLGLQVGAVHTQLDLSIGEPTGEGYHDHSLEALVIRARKHLAGTKQT